MTARLHNVIGTLHFLADFMGGYSLRIDDRDYTMSASLFYGDIAWAIGQGREIGVFPTEDVETWFRAETAIDDRARSLAGSLDVGMITMPNRNWPDRTVFDDIEVVTGLADRFLSYYEMEATDWEGRGEPARITMPEILETIYKTLNATGRGSWLKIRVPWFRDRTRSVQMPWVKFVIRDLRSAVIRLGEATSAGDRRPAGASADPPPFSWGGD